MAQLPRPAAIDVAAAEEDRDAWEDVLDVDDYDLCISPTSSSRPLHSNTAAAPHRDNPSLPAHNQRVPGPASAFQDARRVRGSVVSPFPGCEDPQAADADFLLHPWVCALHFLGKDRAWERPGIKCIKADRELDRAPLVVGMVMSCKPNELGDLFLTLKDPTGTIGASVHRKVLSEGSVVHDISVGCVIVLTKIAVFRPSHAACYLNITQGKVIKVLRKDCGPPFKQDISSEVKWEETQLSAHLGREPLGTSEGTASIFSKMVSRTKHSQVANLHSEAATENDVCGTIWGLDRSKTCSSNSTSAHKSSRGTDGPPQKSFNTPNTRSQPTPCTQASNNEKLRLPFADAIMLPGSKKLKTNVVHPDCYDATMNTSMDTKCNHLLGNNMDIDVHDTAEPIHGGHFSTGKPDGSQQTDFCAANTATAQPKNETSAADAAANNGFLLSHSKGTISVAPVAGWTDCTDEQLSELFADY